MFLQQYEQKHGSEWVKLSSWWLLLNQVGSNDLTL